MIRLDQDLLSEVGLGDLDEDQARVVLAQVYETLEMRVGIRLGGQLSDAQLSEFEFLMKSNDQKGALEWLEANVPDYKSTVAEALTQLREEMASSAAEILSLLAEYASVVSSSSASPDADDRPPQKRVE